MLHLKCLVLKKSKIMLSDSENKCFLYFGQIYLNRLKLTIFNCYFAVFFECKQNRLVPT